MASKFSWECRSCRGITSFRGKYENNSRVYYSVDQYGNPDMGFKRAIIQFVVLFSLITMLLSTWGQSRINNLHPVSGIAVEGGRGGLCCLGECMSSLV